MTGLFSYSLNGGSSERIRHFFCPLGKGENFIPCLLINRKLPIQALKLSLSVIAILILLCSSNVANGQKQLLLMKGEQVKLRLYGGDAIVFKLKNSKRIWRTYVNNLSDTAVVTHSDTIAYHRIERIYFEQPTFYNRLGSALVTAGAALFIIDQFNYVVVQQNSPSLDSWVSKVTVTSIAVGLPMMLIKKKSQRLNHSHRLMMVKEGSPFYRPDSRAPMVGH